MNNILIILFGKFFSYLTTTLKLGNGSTWPGHIALRVNRNFIHDLLSKSQVKIIVIAGTNGKTTTAKMLTAILEKNSKSVMQNASGANLLNGIASSLLLRANILGKVTDDFAILEVDENALPQLLKIIEPNLLVLLNLFRDQLDRYGEVNTIAVKWHEAIGKLKKTTLVLNADDPQIGFMGMTNDLRDIAFGLDEKNTLTQHDADSMYCPNCGTKLVFESVVYSHLGNWHCSNCAIKRPTPVLSELPTYPLLGTYNKYNTLAAALTAKELGLSLTEIVTGLREFAPAFGRQEEITWNGKRTKTFLSKNPTGLNESIRTIQELKAKHILLVLNDRVADGHDVSWIWDADTERLTQEADTITISGDRAYDMGLRIKYSLDSVQTFSSKVKIFEDLHKALEHGVNRVNNNETLYILATYTAMLEVRKIITGKKIL